jgi:hypothetical protein
VRQRARIDPHDPTVHKTDFTVYTEAGAAFFDGRDPYAVSNPRGWHYLYPPLLAIMLSPLSRLETQTQAIVWYFVSLAAAFGTFCECRRLWRSLSSDEVAPPAWLAALGAATVALPALNCLQRGQVGIVLVYFLVLGLRLSVCSISTRGVFFGGLALAAPVTIKLTPLLPVALLAGAALWRGFIQPRSYAIAMADCMARGPRYRGLALAGGQFAGLLLFILFIPAALIGRHENLRHLRTWMDRVVANDDVGRDNDFNERSKRNQSLANAVRRFGNRLSFASGHGLDDRLVDDIANAHVVMPMETAAIDGGIGAFQLLLLGLLATACWRSTQNERASYTLAVFGLACAATLVVSPISWGHHYVMWLPGLIFVPGWLWQTGRRAQAMGLAESALVLVVAHYLVLDHAGRVGLLGIGTAIWCLAAAVSLCRATRRETATLSITDAEETPDALRDHRRAA